jgi:hypothetical protein
VIDGRGQRRDQNFKRNAICNLRAFVPSGCEPSLFGIPKLLCCVSVIGALSGVVAVVAVVAYRVLLFPL